MADTSTIPEPTLPPVTMDGIAGLRTGLRNAALASIAVERRCGAILAAAELLRHHPGAIGHYLDRHVASSAGLSPGMVRWATSEVLGGLAGSGLEAIVRSRLDGGPGRHAVRPTACDIVLAGNVFTACIQPVVLALGLGIPVLCKPASGQAAFPLLLQWALARVDPEVGRALQIVAFSRDDAENTNAFFEHSELVIGYGDDETIQALRHRTRAVTRLVEHGHGISVAYVGAGSLADPRIAAGLALDIAAYDQRGCLSPQVVWLDGKASRGARHDFLRALDAALTERQRTLPRGPLGAGTAAAQMQWRATAAIEGELIEAPDHAIAYDAAARLPQGPQSRNILVRECQSLQELSANVSRFGIHLKQIGFAGDAGDLRQLPAALAADQAPRICSIGTMQTPPFDAYCEGLDPANGLLKWIETDFSAASRHGKAAGDGGSVFS